MVSLMEPMAILERDTVRAGTLLSRDEARFLVDAYYTWQEERKRSDGQIRALSASGEPHDILRWLAENSRRLEDNLRRVLDAYSGGSEVGRWSRGIMGIGPVIAAGLLAHIDIAQAPTVGHIWRFAGQDPTVSWGRGEKRPWNAALKTLCWKIGESFVKVSGRDDDVYGKVYLSRKEWEQGQNEAGAYAEQAAQTLEVKKIGKDKVAYYYYAGLLTAEAADEIQRQSNLVGQLRVAKKLAAEGGVRMLPPAHIHSRAKRYAMKLFLSHWHHVAYEVEYGQPPPMPYVLSRDDHAHFLGPPNWPASHPAREHQSSRASQGSRGHQA